MRRRKEKDTRKGADWTLLTILMAINHNPNPTISFIGPTYDGEKLTYNFRLKIKIVVVIVGSFPSKASLKDRFISTKPTAIRYFLKKGQWKRTQRLPIRLISFIWKSTSKEYKKELIFTMTPSIRVYGFTAQARGDLRKKSGEKHYRVLFIMKVVTDEKLALSCDPPLWSILVAHVQLGSLSSELGFVMWVSILKSDLIWMAKALYISSFNSTCSLYSAIGELALR